MQAVILAAGRGTRLGQGRTPKCLTQIGDQPIIEHQIEAIEDAGVQSVVVVTGFEAAQVRATLGDRVTYVHNPRYAETNSLYSFLLAREYVCDDLLVLNSDVLFHPYIPHMLQGGSGNALIYDSGSGDEEEQMKVVLLDGWLVEMSKQLEDISCAGENLGLLRLGRPAACHAFEVAETLISQGREMDWLGSAINLTAWRHRFRCIDAAGMPWVEIDFPEDLERAREVVWPAIEAACATERSLVAASGSTRRFSRRRRDSRVAIGELGSLGVAAGARFAR